MQNDDQYMERTPDLIAKVRQMREAAEKEMNRFTRWPTTTCVASSVRNPRTIHRRQLSSHRTLQSAAMTVRRNHETRSSPGTASPP